MKLTITLLILFISSSQFIYSQVNRINKVGTFAKLDDAGSYNTSSGKQNYINAQLKLEGSSATPFYIIGPEIPIAGLSGFYDYQTNGECKHYINRFNNQVLHAIYMSAGDSLNISPSRRTKYAFSSNEGETWTYVIEVPNIRSGFCALTSKTNGAAVITNHAQPTSQLYGFLHYDIAPGAGSFTTVQAPFNIVWPGCAQLTNGNIMVVGETYSGGAGTDTGTISIFNTTTNTFGPLIRFYSSATSQTNMRWTYAAGPNGKALYVIDAISDGGGNLGLNRMFYSTSSDNGVTWAPLAVLFNPSIVNGDTLVPFFGLDAIYDQQGNFYVAFNTTAPSGSFGSAKLWVMKNASTLHLVAQHNGVNGIPEAAETVLHADAGICTIDHPTLSVSQSGTCIYVAYSVQFENDVLNGYNKCHIYISTANLGNMSFEAPIKVTNSGPNSFDERYPNIAQLTPNLGGVNQTTVFMAYQKDSQPGSSAFNDGAPITRASLIFRKIFSFSCNEMGIKSIGGEIPKEFLLYQNYPNPFNPNTILNFDIPERSNVTIKVFDALGRLAAILANGELVEPGRKEIGFNASSLSSGIYFYNIEVKQDSKIVYVESKKMILLK